ncbi:unnamed protein product [Moneuplotes crassus]|uniref:Uncharacterized protein n=1 Tax=Euplotes crassus TaxID=5936 RepID=A0AAD1X8T9_EUPCR|nr:unnamed protein product [Moneuplotes crassus]
MSNVKTTNWLRKSFSCLNSWVKATDKFGVPVSLNFKGEDSFKTTVGGIFSLISMLLLMMYTILEMRLVITKGKTSINSNIVSRNLFESKETYQIAKDGFMISMGGNTATLEDPTYFNFQYKNRIIENELIGGPKIRYEDVEYSTTLCGDKFDQFIDKETATRLSMHLTLCPNSSDWRIGGSRTGYQFSAFIGTIKRCSSNLSGFCKSENEINDKINSQKFFVAISNYYFDVEDYDNPVNVTFEDEFNYSLIKEMTVEKTLRVRINKAYDYTNIWYPSNPKEYTYYSIESVKDDLQAEDGSGDLARINIILDKNYKIVERKVYTFYDMLGQVGGVMGIIYSLGSVCVNIFSGKIYIMTLLSYFYKVERRPDTQKVAPLQKISPQKLNSFHENLSKNEIKEEDKFDDSECNIKGRTYEDINLNKISQLKHKLTSLQFYKYSCLDLFYTIFCCSKFRRKRSKETSLYKQYKDYTCGREKITQELDLISIIDTMRTVHVLSNIILDKNKKVLVQNQPVNICSNTKKNIKSDYPKNEEKIEQEKNIESQLEELKNLEEELWEDPISQELFDNIIQTHEVCETRNTAKNKHLKNLISEDFQLRKES